MLAALLCPFLFSLSIVCGHRSAKLIGGTEANFWRLIFATCFLGLWAFGFGRGFEGSGFTWFCLSGLIGIGLGDIALFQALPRLGSRLSMLLIQCLTAPFGALIEWCWLGTSLTAWQIACGAVILLGVGIALSPGEHLQLTRRRLFAGTVFSIISALGGAGGAVASRKAYFVLHANHEHLDPGSAGFQRVVGGALMAAFSLLIVKSMRHSNLPVSPDADLALSHPPTFSSAPSPSSLLSDTAKWRTLWPWILGNSLAGQTLGVTAMQWALETTPTGLVLAIVALTPIVVIPFAFAFEGERPSPRSLLGGAIAVAAVLALTLSRHS